MTITYEQIKQVTDFMSVPKEEKIKQLNGLELITDKNGELSLLWTKK